jgi:hypothetical protein
MIKRKETTSKKILSICLLLPIILLAFANTAAKAENKNGIEKIQAINFDAKKIAKAEEARGAVGFIKNGAFIQFNTIDFGEGKNSIIVDAATPTKGGDIEVRLGDDKGELISTIAITKTGKWDNWTEFKAPLSKRVQGNQKVTLVFKGNKGFLFNIKSFALK